MLTNAQRLITNPVQRGRACSASGCNLKDLKDLHRDHHDRANSADGLAMQKLAKRKQMLNTVGQFMTAKMLATKMMEPSDDFFRDASTACTTAQGIAHDKNDLGLVEA